ncbi:hypothetical protein [Undibacterium sp. RuTC16W]|uniref:hypothetical protein n=1 Tax=Undibacterium sp. RuTC16W TaxID=3413048 RepID=UPI003BF0653F
MPNIVNAYAITRTQDKYALPVDGELVAGSTNVKNRTHYVLRNTAIKNAAFSKPLPAR